MRAVLRYIKRLFTKHPYSVGKTYLGHMWQALSISCRLGLACIAQLIHAIFPFFSPILGTDVWSLVDFLTKKLPPPHSTYDEDNW
jgi:hypothetical protein